ncbi:hypothetical protein GOQ30_05325 [Flavobacterium sp. TP390]|uniref:Uncharacterized protein n=1 Tax=Flavobacterium profundi TaxID=1774945 RepID=A0A6I4IKP1_9FLAO|nr:hypothetical protein [Flavobacterium profundi]MVO08582.1 hypothetical protein [Flavobacterium profundi]
MSINPNSGEKISLDVALELVSAFRSNHPKDIKASFVGIETINLILSQANCIGVRIYNGYDNGTGKLSPVLVGVDSTGKDMVDGVILDRLKPCPEYCDTSSPLIK